MKITYTYRFNNENVTIDIDESDYNMLISLDREDYNLNRKETRRHVYMDAFEFNEDSASENPRMSRDAFEFCNSPDSSDISTELEKKYTLQHIRETINRLKPEQRDLIIAIYFKGVSVKDYAAKEGVDHSAISHRLHTAYKNLKKLL